MALLSAVKLAFQLLFHDRARFLTSIGGVAFAVLLMLIQMGFRNSLLDSAMAMLESFDGEVFVMHKDKDYSLARDTIPILRAYQSASVDGVAAAYPVWFDLQFWKNLETGAARPIRVIGVRTEDAVFRAPDLRSTLRALSEPGTALLDSRSRSYYGHVGKGPAQVQRESLRVIDTFTMATDLEVDGNLVVSDDTYERIGHQPKNDIELVVLKLRKDADPQLVAARLRSVLPTDVAVRTKDEMRTLDREYWDTGTPVSVVVFIGMAMGFAVGVVICYQILFTEVADHLAEFATLRAIGYGKRYVITVVLAEALLLSLVGLVPSLLAGATLYAVLGAATGLLLRLTWARIAFVSVLTVSMCVIAGTLALRKVLQADPAELF